MRRILLLITAILSLTAQAAGHYTVVISLDGCRWDYPQWYDTPFFDQMAAEGVESGLIPSFPSKTFPNHYTLATGLYPDHHGIIANNFFDPATGRQFSLSDPQTKQDPVFYGGEPIWVTAQKNGINTVAYYWAGSDVRIQGITPWRYYSYEDKPLQTYDQRVNGIIDLLRLPEEERPRLIMSYFDQPDYNGHDFGPQDKHTRDAVVKMDRLMRRLYDGIQSLPIAGEVNLIILSDHGMTPLADERVVNLRRILDERWITSAEGNVPANLYVRPGCIDSVCQALSTVGHIQYWRKADVPAYLHYGSNPRVGDIVVLPDLGWVVCDSLNGEYGSHGFDPDFSDMHALFRAVGPDFAHVRRPHFRNVDIYPLLCHLLGIRPAPCDGTLDEIRDILR